MSEASHSRVYTASGPVTVMRGEPRVAFEGLGDGVEGGQAVSAYPGWFPRASPGAVVGDSERDGLVAPLLPHGRNRASGTRRSAASPSRSGTSDIALIILNLNQNFTHPHGQPHTRHIRGIAGAA
jgi:hypothetical protein